MRISDWSSDVCSSDLQLADAAAGPAERPGVDHRRGRARIGEAAADGDATEHLLRADVADDDLLPLRRHLRHLQAADLEHEEGVGLLVLLEGALAGCELAPVGRIEGAVAAGLVEAGEDIDGVEQAGVELSGIRHAARCPFRLWQRAPPYSPAPSLPKWKGDSPSPGVRSIEALRRAAHSSHSLPACCLCELPG